MAEMVLIISVALYWTAAFWLQIYGFNCYLMVIMYSRRRKVAQQQLNELMAAFDAQSESTDLPVVTTQLPIYNERNVVERLLLATCQIDYPREKHEIQVLDDSTDETSQIIARLVNKLRAEGHNIHHIQRKNRVGFKAGALDEGMKNAAGQFIAVFDADFVPSKDFLRKTIPVLMMKPKVGFVQTRWGHRNRNFSLLTALQAIGIDGHFVIEQSARSWNGLFFNFNGTGGIWRREAIDNSGGWQSDTLTEDLDLSYRTQLAGWEPYYLIDVVTPAELPTDINALKSQQHRWAKGSIQTAIKLLPQVWVDKNSSIFKKMQASIHLTHYMVHPLMLLMIVLTIPIIWGGLHDSIKPMLLPTILMFVALFAHSTMYYTSQYITAQSLGKTLILLPVLISLGIGLAINNTKAVFEAVFGLKSDFVRTPKLGAAAEVKETTDINHDNKAKLYRAPIKWSFILEIIVGIGALSVLLATSDYYFVGPILILQSVGFIYIGILSLLHEIQISSARQQNAQLTSATSNSK